MAESNSGFSGALLRNIMELNFSTDIEKMLINIFGESIGILLLSRALEVTSTPSVSMKVLRKLVSRVSL